MNGSNPYPSFANERRTLRDELAIDRTLLANERTLLAYLRSGIALILAGVTFVDLAKSQSLVNMGMVCIPLGVIATIVGALRYYLHRQRLRSLRKPPSPAA